MINIFSIALKRKIYTGDLVNPNPWNRFDVAPFLMICMARILWANAKSGIKAYQTTYMI